MKTLALIPARGGSKGLPGKNIRPLLGKPLIAWSIEQALKSKEIAKTVVSTDDEEIAHVAREYGAEVPFLRPPHLAQDDTPSIAVAEHLIHWLQERGEEYDALMLLQPTSPLRKDGDLDNAVKKLEEHHEIADGLISVGKVQHEHPFLVRKIEDGFVKPYLPTDGEYFQRQQLPEAWFPYGSIFLVKTSALLEQRSFYPQRIIGYEIERWQCYEIDDI